jgi:hypothetical protein
MKFMASAHYSGANTDWSCSSYNLTYYGFMFTCGHQVELLLLMGAVAQQREWNHDAALDCSLARKTIYQRRSHWFRD